MKIAVLTDTHFGVKNDDQGMLDYFDKFYTVFFDYLEKNNIKQVIHCGDFFDKRKNINFLTLNKTKTIFLDKLEKHGITMDIIEGNHDIYFKNTNVVSSLKEILDLYKNINVIDKPITKEFDDLPVDFIPWIINEQNAIDFIQQSKSKIVFGHFELKGYEYSPGVKSEIGMSDTILTKYGQIYSGHYHLHGKNYIGSPYEITWSDYQTKKGFYVFDTKTENAEFVENKHRLFCKIFYEEGMEPVSVKNKIVKVYAKFERDQLQFDKWLVDVNNENPLELTVIESDADNSLEKVEINVDNVDTLQYIKEVIDASETVLDKIVIKKLVTNIYQEAETI